MNVFAKYLLAGLVALSVFLFSWLGGGTFPAWLSWWTPWVTLMIIEVLVILPEVKRNETIMQARSRVWHSLIRDPLLYFGILLTLFLVIQWLNGPRTLFWDAQARQWLHTPPPIPWLPSCINQGEGRSVLDWFPPAIAAALAARHGLLKPTKRLLCHFICWNAAALCLAGLIQLWSGSDFLFTLWETTVTAQHFASFGYPNHAASYFPAAMALSLGLWLWSVEHRDFIHYPPHLLLIPVFLCAAGGILSLSRAGALFTVLVALLGGLYAMIRYWGGWSKAMRMRMGSASFALLAAATACVILPEKIAVRDELIATDWKAFIEHPMLVRSGYQGEAAWEMYKDNPAFGLGAWGYRRTIHRYVKPKDVKKTRSDGQANVHNDSFQFLAEHGTLGFGLMLACALALAVPFWVQLLKSPADAITEEQRARPWPLRINVLYLYAALATLIMAIHSFADLIFRSPACMIVWALCFTLPAGFAFQQAKTKTEPSKNTSKR